MKNGISTNLNLANYATCLKQKGIDFVFRYYSQTTHQAEKRLTMAEAQALSDAGLQIGVVYEDLPTAISYFSGSRGHQDGVNAYHYAVSLHQPVGSAIYFTVDYDASPSDISGSILDYFRGVDQGMRDAGTGASSYTAGVYGSGAVCDFIKSQCPFVKYSWMAESTGWRGSKTYAGWDINQAVAKSDFCGLTKDQYEENRAQDDFGGFLISSLNLT
jgi:hypothetical protein